MLNYLDCKFDETKHYINIMIFLNVIFTIILLFIHHPHLHHHHPLPSQIYSNQQFRRFSIKIKQSLLLW